MVRSAGVVSEGERVWGGFWCYGDVVVGFYGILVARKGLELLGTLLLLLSWMLLFTPLTNSLGMLLRYSLP